QCGTTATIPGCHLHYCAHAFSGYERADSGGVRATQALWTSAATPGWEWTDSVFIPDTRWPGEGCCTPGMHGREPSAGARASTIRLRKNTLPARAGRHGSSGRRHLESSSAEPQTF